MVTYIGCRDLLKGEGEELLIISNQQITSMLTASGALEFELHEEFSNFIEEAMETRQVQDGQRQSQEHDVVDTTEMKFDSEALRRHTELMHQQSRIDFTGIIEQRRRTGGVPTKYANSYFF